MAVININRNQFEEIREKLDITVFAGIEVDLENGHIIVISDGENLDKFDEQCQNLSNLFNDGREYISYDDFISTFSNFEEYLLIPHYKKKPALQQHIIRKFGRNITCGEVDSIKKFCILKKQQEDLVPIFSSDIRIKKDLDSFPTRFTFLDINDTSLKSIKYALMDKNKVFLNDNKNIPEDAKSDVKDILVASDSLLEIVNGVLDISKIEANKIEIVKKEYDTKKMLDELAKLTKVRIGDKPIDFITKFDETLPRVLYGDQTRTKQVILNILTNAAKYTDKGKITFSVQSVIKDNVCRMIISVEDTGRGIKKDSINKLFTKFERLDEENNTTIEGTGLGLAITKKLLEMMHGKIVVQSEYGKGSKFTISLDQRIVKNPTIKLDDEKIDDIEIIDLSSKKVLVVDDNKLNIKVATRLLSPYNVEVVSAESGMDSIEILKKDKKIDLVLMDDMMPKMSGTETLKEIKKNNLYDGPIIVLTANALTGMREKYIEHGFTDYLSKPIEKTELNRILKTYLTK